MQIVQSICKLNEDKFQLICIVSYDFWMLYNTSHLTQFLQFSVNVSKLKMDRVYIIIRKLLISKLFAIKIVVK